MDESEVQIGRVYLCRVGNKTQNVRIDKLHQYGGWGGTLLKDGRKVWIRHINRIYHLIK